MATGAFSPLDRFMNGGGTTGRSSMTWRLADGTLFPIPVTLPVDVDDEVKLDGRVALRDLRNHVPRP